MCQFCSSCKGHAPMGLIYVGPCSPTTVYHSLPKTAIITYPTISFIFQMTFNDDGLVGNKTWDPLWLFWLLQQHTTKNTESIPKYYRQLVVWMFPNLESHWIGCLVVLVKAPTFSQKPQIRCVKQVILVLGVKQLQ